MGAIIGSSTEQKVKNHNYFSFEKRKEYGARDFRGEEGKVLGQSIRKNMDLGSKDLGLGSASYFM